MVSDFISASSRIDQPRGEARSSTLNLLGGSSAAQTSFMTSGRSIGQIYQSLVNDENAAAVRISTSAEYRSVEANAQVQEWFVKKGINIDAYERDMRQL